jgi:tetratricopeptide (TPR) repeat protein
MILYLCLLMLASPALAVMPDYESLPAATPSQADYAAGIAAFKRADWQGVIDHMTSVIEQRPWHDDAYSLLGYASRKLGNYDRALGYYQQALDLNPYHRGALAYLGEAYVEMRCMPQARAMLARLQTVCTQLIRDAATANWQSDCPEWRRLNTVIEAASEPAKQECMLPGSN